MGVDWSKRESAPQYGFLGNASYFITDFGDNVMKTMLMLGDPDMLNSEHKIHHYLLNSRGDLVEFDNNVDLAFDLYQGNSRRFCASYEREKLFIFQQIGSVS